MKKIQYFGLGFSLMFLLSFVHAKFPDVPSNAWFAEYVEKIKDWGVISGNDDGTFAPENNINRAEFAKMLTLYDERVDEKIANNVPTQTSGSSGHSVMYLEKFNNLPAKCPSGWKEALSGIAWSEGGRNSYKRTCYIDKYCQIMDLTLFNEEIPNCPVGWKEADSGILWVDGGQNKYMRVCYICD